MNLRKTIRKVLLESRDDYEMFIIRRYDDIEEMLNQELKDQEACYWKDKYGDRDPEYGYQLFWSVVVRALAERVVEYIPGYYDEYDYAQEEHYLELLQRIKKIFSNIIKEYYNNADCETYGNY